MNCVNCKKEIIPEKHNPLYTRKYCSDNCRADFSKKKYRILNPHLGNGIPTGTVGAINELKVSIDLMKKGQHVFRAISMSCPCDLAILKDGKFMTIEVRTGQKTNQGISWPKKSSGMFDLWAIVYQDNINYFYPDYKPYIF